MKRMPCYRVLLALTFSLSFACKRPPPEGSTVIALVNGHPITVAEVDKANGRELFKMREAMLTRLINDYLLEEGARKAGLSRNDYLRQQLEQRYTQTTEAEAQGFFDRNKDHIQGFKDAKFADVKAKIIQHMNEERRHRAAGVFAEELRNRSDVRVSLRLVVNVDATGPSKGPANAKVTVVEFSEFQCPICGQGRQLMDRLLKEYNGKVRLVFRDFPLPLHPEARKAAEAGHCAEEQGKFWEMHDFMFEHPESLAVGDLQAQARKMGLDGTKFDACLGSGKYSLAVDDNIRAAESYGVTGTPAFFVNGVVMEGVTSYEAFKAEVDRILVEH